MFRVLVFRVLGFGVEWFCLFIVWFFGFIGV